MFEFSPPEARDLSLDVNRVIVLYGFRSAFQPLLDYLTNEKQCGTHLSRDFPPLELFDKMTRNLRKTPDGNVVLAVTDPEIKIPTHIMHGADLVIHGAAPGVLTVRKNRGRSPTPMTPFRCTGASSPTGRAFNPMAGPPLQNIPVRPPLGTGDQKLVDAIKSGKQPSYSMGASVAKADCPMCEAGLPFKPAPYSFKEMSGGAPFRASPEMVMRSKELVLSGPDGREFIKVNADGEAFVRGEKVATGQQDIFEMFRAWVRSQFVMAEVRFPEAGKLDAQGNVFTQECIDQLRKQVGEFGLHTTSDLDHVKADRDNCVQVIETLRAEMKRAVRSWEQDGHVGNIMQRLTDVLEGRSTCNVCVNKKLPNGVDCPNCCASDIKPVSQETAKLMADVDDAFEMTDSLRARILDALKR